MDKVPHTRPPALSTVPWHDIATIELSELNKALLSPLGVLFSETWERKSVFFVSLAFGFNALKLAEANIVVCLAY